MNPPLSPMAQTLLRGHQPNVAAYLNYEALGGTFRESDLKQVDAAYEELVQSGLMQRTTGTYTVLPGIARQPFMLTASGKDVRKNLR